MPGYEHVSGRSGKSQSLGERRWIVRMQRAYPGRLPHLLPDDTLFSKKLVMHAHLQTLHGGVSLTMAKIREKYWIPRLRRLKKRMINEYHRCKCFPATAITNPPTGNLLKERTEVPFKSIGVDFAGPTKYFSKNKRELRYTFHHMQVGQSVPSIRIYYQIKQQKTSCAVWNISWRDEDGQRKSSPINE